MQNNKSYLVFDLSSDCSFGEGLGIYTSFELARKAMNERISTYDETETDVYLHCFLIDLNDPISEYEPIANYAEGEWHKA